MTREHGWECPKCTRIWAPKIAACGACNTEIDFGKVRVGTPTTTIGGVISPPAIWAYNVLPEWRGTQSNQIVD